MGFLKNLSFSQVKLSQKTNIIVIKRKKKIDSPKPLRFNRGFNLSDEYGLRICLHFGGGGGGWWFYFILGKWCGIKLMH